MCLINFTTESVLHNCSASAHMMQSSVQKYVCSQIQNLDDFETVHMGN